MTGAAIGRRGVGLHVDVIARFSSFYARQHICYSAYAIAIPSVCPSVTRVDQSKAFEVRIMQFTPYSSPIPLVSAGWVPSRNSDGVPRGASKQVGRAKKLFFDLCAAISRKRCKIRPKLLLITNRKFKVDRELSSGVNINDLGWPWTAIMHSITLHACLSEPTTKIRMQIDPYCQRRKCSPVNVVSSDIRVMQIFAGVREIWGVKQESCRLRCMISYTMLSRVYLSVS